MEPARGGARFRVPGAQLREVARKFALERPSTLVWCMGATQKTVGTANVRAFSILLLATGNVGGPGNGANIFRGHCNVQGATDFGLDVANLPAYYGIDETAWRHWSRVWGVSYESMVARFDSPQMMTTPGIPSTRYFDAATAEVNPQTGLAQRDRLKAMIVFGHGGNTITRMPEAVRGLEALDLLVVADPHPTTFAVLHNRRENTYLLPICTQFECSGSRTASNRSVQWGSKIVEPIVRIEERLLRHLPPRGRTRPGGGAAEHADPLPGGHVQELRDREQRADAREHPAGDQPRCHRLRLFGHFARAAEGAHGQRSNAST